MNLRHKATKQVVNYVDKAGVDGFLQTISDPDQWEQVSDEQLVAEAKAEKDAAQAAAEADAKGKVPAAELDG